MRARMDFVRVVRGEAFRTLATFVWPLLRMKPNVRLQISALGERFAAMIAHIWLLACVEALMRYCVASLMESLVAVTTFVALDIRMGLVVFAQTKALLEL